MTDVIEVEADETLVDRAVIVKQLAKTIAKYGDDIKIELDKRLNKGDKKTAHTPAGDKLGTVSVSDPEPKAEVVDVEQFEAWIREHHADDLDVVFGFGPADVVAAVLAEHAPDLLTRETAIPTWLRANCLRLAVNRDIPGTRKVRPVGVVSIRPNALAEEIVRELLAGSAIPLVEIEA